MQTQNFPEDLPGESTQEHYNRISTALSKWQWYRDEEILNFIGDNIPLFSRRILDLCGGTGIATSYILRRNSSALVDLVDISAAACSLAKKELCDEPRARVVQSDWTNSLPRDSKYDVILVKNSLHLLDNVSIKLRELVPHFTKCASLIVIETVSPSIIAHEFVGRLFEIAGLCIYKKHFFTTRSIRNLIRESGCLKLEKCRLLDQAICVDEWLEAKCTDLFHRQSAKKFILDAQKDDGLRKAMNIHCDESGRLMMRRLQYCASYVPTVFAIQ